LHRASTQCKARTSDDAVEAASLFLAHSPASEAQTGAFFSLLVVLPGLLPCPPSSASRTRVSGTVPQSWPGCCSLGFGACARLVGHDAMPAQPQPPHQQACLPASLPGSPARPSIARAFGGGLMNKAHSHLPQTTIPLVRFGVGKIARSPLASNCKLPKQL
jgi:hypothetical protein